VEAIDNKFGGRDFFVSSHGNPGGAVTQQTEEVPASSGLCSCVE
jgi:hypothetical protein